MIVDAHAHIYSQLCGLTGSGVTEPLSYGKAKLGTGQVLRFLPPLASETRFPVEALLEYMDWVGVDKAVLLQGPLYGDMNTYVHSAVQKWPDRFIGSAYLNPMLASAPAVFGHLVDELGFGVIKLELSDETGLCGIHTDLRLDDKRFVDWLWEAADSRALTITPDLGSIGGRSYQTQELRMLIEAYSNVRWVIAHLGQPSPHIWLQSEIDAAWTEQVELATYPNVWLDLASLPHYFRDEDYPYPSVNRIVRRAIELVGVEKLLWGTDIPGMLTMLTYQQLRDLIMRHCDCLSQSHKDLIFGANALAAYD